MLLCIDIGNTSIVLGLYKDNKLIESFRLQTNIYTTGDEYIIKISSVLNDLGYKKEDVSGIIISSVVPQLDSEFKIAFKKFFGIDPMFIVPGIKSGINIRIDNPKELGADLLVGAVGAVNKYSAPTIVIDMGTATTLSYINNKCEFLGGIILPGIKTGYNALFNKASKLEEVGIKKPDNVIGKGTVTCIQSGMIYGTSSMIDGLIRKIKKEYNDDCKVVITGGDARYIIDSLEEEVIYDENLLLDGLLIIYNKNK